MPRPPLPLMLVVKTVDTLKSPVDIVETRTRFAYGDKAMAIEALEELTQNLRDGSPKYQYVYFGVIRPEDAFVPEAFRQRKEVLLKAEECAHTGDETNAEM